MQGVAAAGIFTALIININSQSSIHPLPDLRDCSIICSCHSSLCRSDVGGEKERKRKKKEVKRKSPKPSFLPGSPYFSTFLLPLWLCHRLFDIFPEETVLCFSEPVVSWSSPHLTLRSPPLLPHPQIMNRFQIQLWKQAPTQSYPGFYLRKQAARLTRDREMCQQFSSSPGIYSTPYSTTTPTNPHSASPFDERAKGAFHFYMEAPKQPKRQMSEVVSFRINHFLLHDEKSYDFNKNNCLVFLLAVLIS